MLDHVRCKQMLTEFVQGRQEREYEGGPAGPERRGLPELHASADASAMPEPQCPAKVEDGGGGERRHDERREAPTDVQRVEGMPTAMRERRLRQERREEHARRCEAPYHRGIQ